MSAVAEVEGRAERRVTRAAEKTRPAAVVLALSAGPWSGPYSRHFFVGSCLIVGAMEP